MGRRRRALVTVMASDPARAIIRALGAQLGLWLQAKSGSIWIDAGPVQHTVNAVGTPDYSTNTVNGKPVVTFSGDDYFAIPTLGVALAGSDVPYTELVVVSGFSGTDVAWFSLGNTGSATQFVRHYDTSNVMRYQRKDDAASVATAKSSAGSLSAGWQILVTRFNGTTLDAWNNGVKKVDAAPLNVGVCTFNTAAIGCLLRTSATNILGNHQIAAHIMLYGATTAATINLVQNYLATWYGQTVSQIT